MERNAPPPQSLLGVLVLPCLSELHPCGRMGGSEAKQYEKRWWIHQEETDEGVPPASYNLPKSHTTRTKQGHAPAALSAISDCWKANRSTKSSPATWRPFHSDVSDCISFPLKGRDAPLSGSSVSLGCSLKRNTLWHLQGQMEPVKSALCTVPLCWIFHMWHVCSGSEKREN